jgi:hypothetical protein
MRKHGIRRLTAIIAVLVLTAGLTACAASRSGNTTPAGTSQNNTNNGSTINNSGTTDNNSPNSGTENGSSNNGSTGQTGNTGSENGSTSTGNIDGTSGSDLFSSRDLEQTADLSEATNITVKSGEDVTITAAGVYVLSGTATDATVIIEADKDKDKVQLVLNGLTITNADAPAIYVKSADKVFVTTASGTENTLKTTGTFKADGETNLDAVIYSKDDLTLNGLGTLNIESTKGNAVSCKDDLKVTGGTYVVNCALDAFEANDSIRIAGGTFTITTSKDGFHSENSDDNTVGYIYISGGTIGIKAKSDGLRGTTTVTIDGGNIDITASEGIEATHVAINDGTVNINASDDGINASQKSTAENVLVELNGGNITIVMGQGDTDAVDSNGSIAVTGGNINITATVSSFDYDVSGTITGGTVIVNGTQISEMPNQQFGPGGMGGGQMRPGGQGGQGGQGGWPGRR